MRARYGLYTTALALVFLNISVSGDAGAQTWPNNPKLSGNSFLSPGLLKLQADVQDSPVSLWLDKGQQQWADRSGGASCQSCHTSPDTLKKAVPTFPKLAPDTTSGNPKLINLEDQIVACRTRAGRLGARLDDDDVLSLSALLHNAAKGLPIDLQAPPANSPHAAQWQSRLDSGTALFAKRLGRINLACVHCHEQNIGKQMRVDVISPGNPTGFPIYRMSWQKIGSMDRRIRACYSGVQAVIPPPGAAELRDLELYLKVRAYGMPLEGPSIRR